MEKYHSLLFFLILFLQFSFSTTTGIMNKLIRRTQGNIVVDKLDTQSFYFTGAGIYFWWQAGAAKYIQRNCDCQNQMYPIIGASAGSLTATMLLSGCDFDKAANEALLLAYDQGVFDRKAGLVGILGNLVYQWLDKMIPDEVSPQDLANLYISLTPLTRPPYLVSNFSGKVDVIDACMASCHLPIIMDGKPTNNYRGDIVLDGSFWYFITKNRFNSLPIPENVKLDDICWVDYCDDDLFLQQITGNIIETVAPSKIGEMMEMGYNYMKREHQYGRLPRAKYSKPSFVLSSEGRLPMMPEFLSSMKLSIDKRGLAF